MRASEGDHGSFPTAHGVFVTTRWSRVVKAGDLEQADAGEALAELCRDYWRPLYCFARGKGRTPEDAQDLTQGFLANLLEKNGFAAADRTRGRFRTFLLGAFCHFMANQHRDQARQKRGGGAPPISLHDPEVELLYAQQARDEETPERIFERSWALALLERVMDRLRGEYDKAGRGALFSALQPQLTGGGRPGYAKMAAETGLSESALTVALHRMRKRYGLLLRQEITDLVESEGEVEDELRHLMAVLAPPGGRGFSG